MSSTDLCPNNDTSTSTTCVVVVVGSLNVVLTSADPCADLDGMISLTYAGLGGCIDGGDCHSGDKDLG